MQKLYFLSLLAIIFISSCAEDTCQTTYTYQMWEPVYRTADELKDEVSFEADRELESPGKIYYFNNYVLINERGSGVHVIDNSDIRNPQKLGFIAIDGNIDIALGGKYLYADTHYNILIIDISDLEKPNVVNVINEVKEQPFEIEPGRFIVDYVATDVTETLDCSDEEAGNVWFARGGGIWLANGGCPNCSTIDFRNVDVAVPQFSADAAGVPQGQAGSMSRMALFNGHFYYVNQFQMHVFDASNLAEPRKASEVFMEWGVETIFPYRTNLFIGANNGMHIYDNTDPANPEYMSTFAHANACDPVVVQDDIAYVTLRDGNECQNFINQLDVVDVSNLREPELIASFEMHNPHGLAVRDETLYICEGDEGLKVFDIAEVEEIGDNQVEHVRDYQAYDVISLSPELLLMVGEDGFYQFDTRDRTDLSLLSSIKVGE